MAGQLIQRGDRTWLVRVYRGRDPVTGKRRYQNTTVKGTKKDAQRLLNKLLREQDLGLLVEPSRMSLSAYLDRWLETSAKPRVRLRTYLDYCSLLDRYIRPELGGRRLDQLTPSEIQRVYAEMQEKGLSARTIRYTHSVLRSALQQAVRWNMLARNPADLVDLPRQARQELRALSSEEVSRFLEAARSDRWYALWYLLVATGMRPGEALGLKWSDLDGDRIRIQRVLVRLADGSWTLEEPKTDRSRRTVALSAGTVRVLQQHRAQQAEEILRAGEAYHKAGLLFANRTGWPLDYRVVVQRHFKPLVKKAGLRAVRPYDLRHTSATLLLAHQVHPKIVSERLGHSSTTLTLDTYSHVLPDMQSRAAEYMDLVLEGESEALA